MRSSGDDSGVGTRATGCRVDGRVETAHRFSGGIERRAGLDGVRALRREN